MGELSDYVPICIELTTPFVLGQKTTHEILIHETQWQQLKRRALNEEKAVLDIVYMLLLEWSKYGPSWSEAIKNYLASPSVPRQSD